jgi:hypothetical protein
MAVAIALLLSHLTLLQEVRLQAHPAQASSLLLAYCPARLHAIRDATWMPGWHARRLPSRTLKPLRWPNMPPREDVA